MSQQNQLHALRLQVTTKSRFSSPGSKAQGKPTSHYNLVGAQSMRHIDCIDGSCYKIYHGETGKSWKMEILVDAELHQRLQYPVSRLDDLQSS